MIKATPYIKPKKRWNPAEWGGWRFDRETLSLTIDGDGFDYEVDLERCYWSGECLDWLAQIAHKTWCDDNILAGLVRALDDIMDFQETLCRGKSGKSRIKALAQSRNETEDDR